MIIDIIVAVAFRGGVEEVINITASYMEEHGDHVRIIHALWQGEPWANEELDFHYLYDTTEEEWNGDLGVLSERYMEYLSEAGRPDGVICAGWPLMIPMAKKAIESAGYAIPVISWLHGGINAYADGGYGGYDELNMADGHIAINTAIASGIFTGTGSTNIYCVKNPVDLNRIVFKKNRDFHKLAYVGRLAAEKNIPFLLQAFSMTPPAYSLKIVGDADPEGNGLCSVKEYARELGINDRVEFPGWKTDPWTELEDAGILLLTSDREGYPLVVIEAMLCGMCVISTPTEGAKEMIIPGKNGFLFPFGDHAFLNQLLRFLDEGKMMVPSADECRDTFSYILKQDELADFLYKLHALINGEILRVVYEPGKELLYLMEDAAT